MPLLRSQTRGETKKIKEVNDLIQNKPLSTSLPSVMCSLAEDQLITITTTPASSPAITTPATMFPFPPAPVISSAISSAAVSIINISNASSESSSETSSSASNKSSSRPNSPAGELEDQSELLNLAMVEDSVLEEDSPTLQEVPADLHGDGRSSRASLHRPALQTFYPVPMPPPPPGLAASSPAANPSLVYNLVTDQANLQEDRDTGLHLCLQQFQCYEDEAGMKMRTKVVTELDTLVRQWIRSEGLRRKVTWSLLEQVGGKVVSFGSFKLSVVDKESDLDLLCVVPKHVTRDQFFTTLYDLLLKKEEVSELRQLPEAYVPVIKMKFRGLEVDLTMARVVNSSTVPEDETFLMKDSLTKDMDPKCVRSLNGYRATCEILQLVPNVEKFRLTLRVVKLWAKKQGIYGNMLGFLGGASWAILVAKACQMSEGRVASVADLIYFFFLTFAAWEWPKPVYIKKVEVAPYPAWNPKINPRDAEHCMPIITTSQPQMNSAFNMCRQNCQLITAKCQEAVMSLYAITQGTKHWADLFVSRNFFEEFDHYLMVVASCQGDSSLWFGSVESKLRQLAYHVMFHSKVATVRVWPQPFLKQDGPSWVRQMWFFGIKMVVGNSPEAVTEPLYTFEELCKLDASKLVSPFSASFHVSPKYLTASQLGLHLTKQQLSLGRSDKLTYAAVTLGQPGTPMMLSNLPSVPSSGYMASVPILSPATGQSQLGTVYHTPLTGLPGLGGVLHNPNIIVYSLAGAGDHHQSVMVNRPQSHQRSSPQPGGYPTKTRTSGSNKSPVVMTRKFQPPPMSPMTAFSSTFSSPPPGLDTKLPNTSEDSLSVRTTHRRPKEGLEVPDRLRSVSNSSDKFPPPSLNRARVNHQDQLPLMSPSYSAMAMTGVRPLVDTSVPPPSLPTPPPSVSPPVSFNIAKKKAWRSGRSPRVSISEVSDLNSPQPVRGCSTVNQRIKLSLSTRSRPEDVFEFFQV